MRTLLFMLLLIPAISLAQNNQVFIKLTNADGKQITGDVVTRGFEGQVSALTISSSGKNNSQFIFTMPVGSAGGSLKNNMTSGQLLSSVFVFVATGDAMGRLVPVYTITMEQVRVVSCSETMGCNSQLSTGVVLQATRIGWTYYQQDRRGMSTVSQKTGWDSTTGQTWTGF